MAAPIGVSFVPSAQNQEDGKRRGGLEGGLGQSLKVLNLRLPTVAGARALTPQMGGPGAGGAGLPSQPSFIPPPQTGMPAAAEEQILQSVINAILQGGAGGPGGGAAIPDPVFTPGLLPTDGSGGSLPTEYQPDPGPYIPPPEPIAPPVFEPTAPPTYWEESGQGSRGTTTTTAPPPTWQIGRGRTY